TIIVADDEEYARSVAKEALEGHGFTVHTAHNGREAIELLRQHANEVVAILLDLTMPVMSGDEAFGHLRAIRPDVPIILSSGYSEDDAVKRLEGCGPSAFIQKPYVLLELTAKFYHVLERPVP
ncbi:MAG: response regulator, partial [Candidatus Hydrogenedentes bacterium]|nr:response regulator [Candidatus Hydrogenedentota bacterium]